MANLGRGAAMILTGALAWTAGAQTARKPASEPVITNSLGMRMVLLPAGTFLMGSPPDAAMRQEEEHPHRVTLTRPIRIGATEVTQGQWRRLMAFNRSPQQGDDLPVSNLSWHDAQEFCRRLSERESAVYRLPTEAEWEYACRAAASVPGRTELEQVAWYADNSGECAHPVGLKKPDARGLYDVLGNVAEWTLDVYGPYPRVEGVTDPTGPAEGATRSVRGGSWRSFPPALRCAARTGTPESYQLPHVGLRVVQEAR